MKRQALWNTIAWSTVFQSDRYRLRYDREQKTLLLYGSDTSFLFGVTRWKATATLNQPLGIKCTAGQPKRNSAGLLIWPSSFYACRKFFTASIRDSSPSMGASNLENPRFGTRRAQTGCNFEARMALAFRFRTK